MRCPACDAHIVIEDWNDDTPFDCPECGAVLQLVTDEGGYCGAAEKRLIVVEEE
jgi:hypothetical protein